MLRTLAVFAPDYNLGIFWRLDGEYAPITFIADVSDVFWWGAADGEEIRMADVPLLEQAAADLAQAGEDCSWVGELYAARKRQTRPQGAMYSRIPAALHPLFDAAGSSRATGLGNPHHYPDDETGKPGAV
jgi:hypothetical protein